MELVFAQVDVSWDLRYLWEEIIGPLWVWLLLLLVTVIVLIVPRWRKKVFGR